MPISYLAGLAILPAIIQASVAFVTVFPTSLATLQDGFGNEHLIE
jgi:hypothetical protein